MAPRKALALVFVLTGIMLLPFAAIGWFQDDWHVGEDWHLDWNSEHDADERRSFDFRFAPRGDVDYSGPLDNRDSGYSGPFDNRDSGYSGPLDNRDSGYSGPLGE